MRSSKGGDFRLDSSEKRLGWVGRAGGGGLGLAQGLRVLGKAG